MHIRPDIVFKAMLIIGIGLMFSLWVFDGEVSGFFLMATLTMLVVLRRRFAKLKYTVLVDIALCIALASEWGYAAYFMALPLFSAMYLGVYFVLMVGVYLLFDFDPLLSVMLLFSATSGLFLRFWAHEYAQKLLLRDEAAKKYYKMQENESSHSLTLAEVERMAGISERTRIARDIHDNAGHEIVAAYISFQAIRKLLGSNEIEFDQKAKILEMYDGSLKRLNNGTGKIRETAHNLQSTTLIGVDSLSEICDKFPLCPIDFNTYGDTSRIPMYVWSALSSCLNECLTNVARHSKAETVKVTLDVTRHIVRLCVENDGVTESNHGAEGTGLRNLRSRANTVGGSLAVDKGDMFRVICVIPIKEEAQDESIDC